MWPIHENNYSIAGNFWGVLNFVIFGVQFRARKLKPTKISTCVLRLSARYSSHEITKIKFRGPFEEVTKIASPENYQLYGIHDCISAHACVRFPLSGEHGSKYCLVTAFALIG